MQDRRQFPRFIPDSALLVSLGTTRRGFLCDLSEGGMAFDGFLPQTPDETLPLAFRLPDGGDLVEAIAQVVWTCDSRHRTGVRFVELAERPRQQIREWLSKHIFTLEEHPFEDSEGTIEGAGNGRSGSVPPLAGGREQLRFAAAAQDAGALPSFPGELEYAPSGQERMSEHYQTTYSVAPVLGVIALCAAFVGLGYYLPNIVIGPKTNPAAGIAEFSKVIPVASAGGGVSTRTKKDEAERLEQSALGVAAPTGTVAGAVQETPAERNGYVLQLAAMTHKENADALAETLRRSNFPAFVQAREGDRFYRVNVGPYPDAAYARSVRDELKGGGFGTALERPPSSGRANSGH